MTELADGLYPSCSAFDINNNNLVVFVAAKHAFSITEDEIYLYANGTYTRITHNSYPDGSPKINDHGDIVWHGAPGAGSYDWTEEAFFYNNATRELKRLSFFTDNYGAGDLYISNERTAAWKNRLSGAIYRYDAKKDLTEKVIEEFHSNHLININTRGILFHAGGSNLRFWGKLGGGNFFSSSIILLLLN